MSKAKFTQDQLDEAMAEFFGEYIEPMTLPAAGYNGSITVYKKDENGPSQAASE